MAFIIDDREELPISGERRHGFVYADRPLIAAINRVAAELVVMLQPMFWAALVLLYINALLSAG